jgi:acetoin utilization protein AcuC
MSEQIGIMFSEKLQDYDFGPGHPFRGDRFGSFMAYFQEKLGKSERFEVIMNDEGASDDDLSLWHEEDYIRAMQEASADAPVPDLLSYVSPDNVNPRTRHFPKGIEKAARVVVKNSMLACELVEEREYEKVVSIGGGLHHAKPRYGEGFCVYNDVVISAKHLMEKYRMKRILLLDTDAHAGNGTSEAFYSDPRVLLIDLHQKHIYPGTGCQNELGEGEGEGFTVNIALPAYANDQSYRLAFDEIVFPLAEEFDPQFIIRNGGSDPHPSDEITQLGLTLEGFKYIGKSVREIAKMCDDKEADLICSGYKPQVLSRAWLALILGLADIEIELEEPTPLRIRSDRASQEVQNVVSGMKKTLQSYWNI